MKVIWSFIILAVFILIGFYFLDTQKIITHLKSANLFWTFLSALALVTHFLVRGERLKIIAKLSSRTHSYKVIFASNFLNAILPFRIGEIAKIGALHIEKNSVTKSIFAVFIERMFDLLIVLVFFTFSANTLSTHIGSHNPQLVFFFLVIIFGVLFLQVLRSGKIMKILLSIQLPKKIAQILFQLKKASEINYPLTLIISLAIWLITACFHFLTAKAMLVNLTFDEVILLTVLNSLFISIPSSPGFVGPYQASFALFAHIKGHDTELFVAIGILSHLINYVVLIPSGLFSMATLGLKVKDFIYNPAHAKISE